MKNYFPNDISFNFLRRFKYEGKWNNLINLIDYFEKYFLNYIYLFNNI